MRREALQKGALDRRLVDEGRDEGGRKEGKGGEGGSKGCREEGKGRKGEGETHFVVC